MAPRSLRPVPWIALLAAWVGCAGGCAGGGGSAGDPDADLSQLSAREFFELRVMPVLQRAQGGCADETSCHGEPEGVDREAQLQDQIFGLPKDGEGRLIAEGCYESARQFINTIDGPPFSTLIRKVVPVGLGGLQHNGGVIFEDREAEDYRAISAWIERESEGPEGLDPAELTPLERLFGDTVQPVLKRRRCMTKNCHGPRTLLSKLNLDPGVEGAFSADQTRTNYRNARTLLHLEGDVGLSRLVLKALPLGAGGILHKGGNSNFFPAADEAGVQAILEWARREQRELFGGAPEVQGIVFARGPAIPRPPFDVGRPWWGSDIWKISPAAPGGRLVNLTRAHHAGEADVRDPAVNHEGTLIAFSMRKGPEDAWNLYQMDVDGGALRQITDDTPQGDFVPANVQPTWGADGHLYFVSTRHNEPGDRGTFPNADLYRVHPLAGGIRRLTFGPNHEVRPAFFRIAGVAGQLAFTTTRRFGESFNAPIFRFPPRPDGRRFHQVHFGTQLPGVLLGVQDTPYGLHMAALLHPDAVWAGGALVLFDRNMGPDITDGSSPEDVSLPRFASPLTYLTGPVGEDGVIADGILRDPYPLPDGRMLVAYQEGPVDTLDASRGAVDYGIWTLELAPDEAGRMQIVGREPLVDGRGLSDLSPRPIVRRALHLAGLSVPPGEGGPGATGKINMFSMPLHQAIVTTLSPKAKALRDDLRFARILTARPTYTDPVDVARVRNGDPASNDVTNGVHDRQAILGTVPLASDGSFYVEVPAEIPVRFQALNGDRMAVGRQHDRWVWANRRETLQYVISLSAFQLCSPCHGSLGGDPAASVGVLTDAISGASISLSTHRDGNPLEKLEAIPVGLDGAPTTIDFETDLQPILNRSCAIPTCHAGGRPAGDLSLTAQRTTYYNDAYESLMREGPGSGSGRRYVDEPAARAISSRLIEKIYGRDLEAPAPFERPCPPPGSGAPPLSEAEKLRFVQWIDLGAVFDGAQKGAE